MADGFFAGGFADSLNQAEDRYQKQQASDAQIKLATGRMNMEQSQKLVTDSHSTLDKMFASAKTIVDNIVAQGGDPKSPEAQKALTPIITSALHTAALLDQTGLAPGTYSATENQYQSLITAPSLKAKETAKSQAEASGKVAGAKTVTEETGNPIDATLQAAGVIPKDKRLIQVNTKDKILLVDPDSTAVVKEFPVSANERGTSRASSINLIYRLAGGAYGGVFDQQGNLVSLDPSKAPAVQAAVDRAFQLLAADKADNEASAVSMALREAGKSIPALGKTAGGVDTALPPGLPTGTIAMPDGTFKLPNGTIVKPKAQ